MKKTKEYPFRIGKLNKEFSIPEQVLWDNNKTQLLKNLEKSCLIIKAKRKNK